MQTSIPLSPLTLFLAFFKAGGLTVGDGYATIQPLRQTLVEKNGWLTGEDFAKQLAVVQVMPGIFNVNLAAYLGHHLDGWRGCAAALLGMTLPPLAIFVVFATFFNDFRHFAAVEGFLRGARPAIVALILLPCLQMWRQSRITLSTVWIPVGAAIGIGLLGVSPSYIILGLTLLALLYGALVREQKTGSQEEETGNKG